jgi:hypothetical protein
MSRHAPYLLMLVIALAVTPVMGQAVMINDDGVTGLEANAAPPDEVTLTVEAVRVWQDLLTQHPAVLDAYADLLTRYCHDQLKQHVDLPYVEVTQREYYYACPPNESILEYARSQGGAGSLGEVMRRWWVTYAAAPAEAQPNADASGLVAVLPPAERAKMWRLPGTGGDQPIGLLPCMLQPSDESAQEPVPPVAEAPPDDGLVPWTEVPQTTSPDTGYVDTTPYVNSYDRLYGTYPYSSSGSYSIYYGSSPYCYSPYYSWGVPLYGTGSYIYPYGGLSFSYGGTQHRYWKNYGAPYGGPYWHNYGAPYGNRGGTWNGTGNSHRYSSGERPSVTIRSPSIIRSPSRGTTTIQRGYRGTGQRGSSGNTIRRDVSPRIRSGVGTHSSPRRSTGFVRPARPSRSSGHSSGVRSGHTPRFGGGRSISRPSSTVRRSTSRGGRHP